LQIRDASSSEFFVQADIETFKKLYRDGQFLELRPLLEQTLRKSPGNAEVLSWAARCALALRNPEEAESYAARALAADPSRQDASRHLAKAQLSLEAWAAARETAGQVLANDPGNADFRVFAGRASHGMGDHAAALDHFRIALAQRPDDYPILKFAGEAALRAGDAGFAVEAFSELAEHDAQAALAAVQVLRESSHTVAAAAILETVLRLQPGDERVMSRAHALVRELVLRANMAQQNGQELEAAKFHAVALRLEPEARQSQRFVQKHLRDTRRAARETQKAGDLPQALSLLEDLTALTPGDPQLLYDIAHIKQKLGDGGAAVAWLAAAGAGPHEDPRLLVLAERLNGYGHLAESAALLGQLSAAGAEAENGQRIRNKVIVGLQHGLTKATRAADAEDLQKLLSALKGLDPENPALARFEPKAITLRARALREARLAGDAEAVERHARGLLELESANTAAMRYLTNSYTRRGKWRDALPIARELARQTGGDSQSRRSLARICYFAREREEGLAVCEAGLASDPEDAQLLLLRDRLAALPAPAA
jgi:thioredoxin-like negative regulator of GroEL